MSWVLSLLSKRILENPLIIILKSLMNNNDDLNESFSYLMVSNNKIINISLNEDLLEDFNKNGFLVLDKFIDLQYLEDLRERIEPLFKGEFETGIEPDEWNWKYGKDSNDVTRQICNAWKSDNIIKQVVCNPTIGKCVSKLMGWKGARLLQDNVLWKPPQGKSLIFHQDASYDDWIIPQTMVTCWMPLDDTQIENGTLEFVTGSHKWDLCILLQELSMHQLTIKKN